jgi:hypothetical protein
MASPAPGQLTALAAFHVDVGDDLTNMPLQFAIPIDGSTDVQAGDEVLFLKRGTIADENGVLHDTWWILDNGYVGADGMARTASPPYDGIESSGDILVVKALPIPAGLAISGSLGGDLWIPSLGLSGSLFNSTIAALATTATTYVMSYSYNGTYRSALETHAGPTGNTVITLPTMPVTSASLPAEPQITSYQVLPDGTIRITGSGLSPSGADSALWVWLRPDGFTGSIPSNLLSALASGRDLIGAAANGITQSLFKVTLSGSGANQTVDIRLPAALAGHVTLSMEDITLIRQDKTGSSTQGVAGGDPGRLVMSGAIRAEAPNVSLVSNGQ